MAGPTASARWRAGAEVDSAITTHGHAVHLAARALVAAGADELTVDVFRHLSATAPSGEPISERVRGAFVAVAGKVQPPPPQHRLRRAEQVLAATAGGPPPTSLKVAFGAGTPEADPESADNPWLLEVAPSAATPEPQTPDPHEWTPAGRAEPAAVASVEHRPPRRRLRPAWVLVAALAVLGVGAGAYALNQRGDEESGSARQASPDNQRRAAAALALGARVEYHVARAEGIVAHADEVARDRAEAVFEAIPAPAAPAPAPAAPAPAPAAPAPAPAAPAPAPAAPAPTAAPPTAPVEPPVGEDPPGREAPG